MKTILFLVALLFIAKTTQAQTLVEQRAKEIVRYNTLEKLTAGPNDSYQGVVGEDAQVLFFTKNIRLASHVYRQSMREGAARALPVGPENNDTRDPALSPDGKLLAFTSFENNARGDVCYRAVGAKDSEPNTCLNASNRGAEQPYWKSNDELIFIQNGYEENFASLVSLNILNGTKKVLFQDEIVSFAVHSERQMYVYASSQGDRRVLKVRTADANKQPNILDLDLPGVSSFPRFDEQGEFLYFSQFFSDTNDDNIIDANDNSVVFRISWNVLENSKTRNLPEQLTSLENSCNFPFPKNSYLYVTCAFEDTLDIYRLPVEGMVPMAWDQARLWDAYKAARTFEERILLLNTIRFRFLPQDSSIVEKVFSNHVLSDEVEPALYYLEQIQKTRSSPTPRLAFYESYLKVLQQESLQPLGRPTPNFIFSVQKEISKLKNMQFTEPLSSIVAAFMQDIVGNTGAALQDFQKIDGKKIKVPMDVFLYASVGERLYSKNNVSFSKWEVLYSTLASHPAFSEETQSYYSLLYLMSVEKFFPNWEERLQFLETKSASVKHEIFSAFLNTEVLALKTSYEPVVAKQTALYKELDKQFVSFPKKYFVKRGLYIRALSIFNEANQEELLNQVAHRWLTSTGTKDAEFVYARELYVKTRLDKAYAFINEKKFNLAADVFYTLIRVTDDPEAHVGYIHMMKEQGKTQELAKSYQDLVQKNFVGKSIVFWEAEKNLGEDPSKDDLEDALETLDVEFENEFKPAVRQFLIAYAYHKQTLLSRKGLEFDADIAELAFRHYAIALDGARDNRRLLAAIYYNLGLLQFSTRNFGDSVGYFQTRLNYPFPLEQRRLAFYWLLARAHFYNRDATSAVQTAQEGLKVARQMGEKKFENAFLERVAFYAVAAENYTLAKEEYLNFLKLTSLTELQRSKAELGFGYALFQLGDLAEAKVQLSRSLSFFEKQSSQLESTTEIVALWPTKQQVILLGLLAESEPNLKLKANYRSRRVNLLKSMENSLKDYAMKKEDWRNFILKDCNTLTQLRLKSSDLSAARAQMNNCIEVVEDHYDLSDDALDVGLYQHTYNALALAAALKLKDEEFRQVRADAVEIAEKMKPLTQANDAFMLRWVKLKSQILVFDSKVEAKISKAGAEAQLKEFFSNLNLPPNKEELRGHLEREIEAASARL